MKNLKKMSLLAFAVFAVFMLSTCDWDDFIATYAADGVYVGEFTFFGAQKYPTQDLIQSSGKSNTATSTSLIYLNATGADNAKAALEIDWVPPSGDQTASPLVYAVDQAIKKLKSEEKTLPKKLANVTIVSFTKGYDQGSADYAKAKSEDEYFASVQKKINTTKVRGNNITAYAIAVEDSSHADLQNKTLRAISSGGLQADGTISTDMKDYNVIKQANYNQMTSVFSDIASSLTSVKFVSSLTITISGPTSVASYTAGDNFCATFDGKDPAESGKKLTGKVEREESGKWKITNVEFTGMNATVSDKTIKETGRRGIYTDFGLPGATGVTASDTIKQFRWDNDSWLELMGADKYGYSYSAPVQKSAIVFLVLDATLDTTQQTAIKTAAKGFIDQLYTESKEQ